MVYIRSMRVHIGDVRGGLVCDVSTEYAYGHGVCVGA